jgi:Xaa-Pro aminopeptidase
MRADVPEFSGLLPAGLSDEVESRIDAVRTRMAAEGLSTLIVYANNKINGSLRYLTGYWPDRGGWLAAGPTRADIKIFDGAMLVLPLQGEPVLVFDKGQLLDREACTLLTTTTGFGGELADDPSVAETIATIVNEQGGQGRVGIETWDKFPAPLYLELVKALPDADLTPSMLVEEVSLVKSAWEIDIFRKAGEVGDIAHAAFVDALRHGIGKNEVQLVRAAETAMRDLDPIYEEISPISPSLISSGQIGRLGLLHTPQWSKTVDTGDAVNWDLAGRHIGYPVDTSRTRVVGKPTQDQERAYATALTMSQEVMRAIKPGTQVQDLVNLASSIAKDAGFDLWDRFLGHGLGLDVHGRPDMGLERMELVQNMVITVEPRVALNGQWLFGNEDMVLVTEQGCESLTAYPKEPLEL